MADKVRIGLIGTGGIMGMHMGNLQEIADAEVVALVDPDPARIDGMKARWGTLADAAAYADYPEMIEAGGLDAVIIASPHNVHCRQIVDCLQAGLHVLTEKPMVCTIDDAKLVMAEEEKSGKVLSISYQRHSQGEFQFIRNHILSGEAGEVQFLSALQGQNWLKGCTGLWRQVMEISCGGQLNDSGSHLIDIILWVTGLEVSTVNAAIRNFEREVDINSALAIEFKNGALGTLSVIGNCPIWWEDITIVCSNWSFFMRQGKLTYTTGDQGEVLSLQSTNYGSKSPDHNFVGAVLGREEVLAPSVCGLRTIELTEAAWRSAAEGGPVSI